MLTLNIEDRVWVCEETCSVKLEQRSKLRSAFPHKDWRISCCKYCDVCINASSSNIEVSNFVRVAGEVVERWRRSSLVTARALLASVKTNAPAIHEVRNMFFPSQQYVRLHPPAHALMEGKELRHMSFTLCRCMEFQARCDLHPRSRAQSLNRCAACAKALKHTLCDFDVKYCSACFRNEVFEARIRSDVPRTLPYRARCNPR